MFGRTRAAIAAASLLSLVAPGAALAAGGVKALHVEAVLRTCAACKDLENQIEETYKKMKKDLESQGIKADELEKARKEILETLQDKLKKDEATVEEVKGAIDKDAALKGKVDKFEKDKTEQAKRGDELMFFQTEGLKEIRSALNDVMTEYVEEQKPDIIVPIQGLIYRAESVDITEDITKRLDKKITKVKAKLVGYDEVVKTVQARRDEQKKKFEEALAKAQADAKAGGAAKPN